MAQSISKEPGQNALEKDAYAPIAVAGGGIAGVEAFFSLWILFHL